MKYVEHRVFGAGFFVILAALMLCPGVHASGVGIGPTDITIANALRGTVVERSVTVYNLGDTDATINLSTTGPAGAWVTFHPLETRGEAITSLGIKARTNAPVLVRLTIPSDTANGVYNATIRAQIRPTAPDARVMMVNTIMEAVSTVSVDVTGVERKSGTVAYVSADDTEAGFPLPVKVLFQNTGNVAVNPEIQVTIAGKSGTIDTFSSAGVPVNAGKAEAVIVYWNNTGVEPGNYTARVKVSVGTTGIHESGIPFKIFPAGTLSRQGEFLNLSYEGVPAPGSVLKIVGIFENTGKIGTKAKLTGEIYRDGSLVDTFTSDELSIPIGERGELTSYLKPDTAGAYTIKTSVLYEGKKTPAREFSFTVTGVAPSLTQPPNQPPVTYSPLPPLGAIVAVISAVVLLQAGRKAFR